MGRAQMWDGLVWIDMTGGAGEEAPENPENIYLRLDGVNNPASPNNFLTTNAANALYLPLGGGTLTGDVNLNPGVDILGSTTSLIKGQDWQFAASIGAFKDSLGVNRITFLTTHTDLDYSAINNGAYVASYNPSPQGGGAPEWYQIRNARFKDTPGPPSDSEGLNGDVCFMYQF